jgi:hypothetical protein
MNKKNLEIKEKSLAEKGLGGLLFFILGFSGFAILGAVLLTLLISFGILPEI